MNYSGEQKTWLTLRLLMAFIFLWAFVDKLWGLGFATAPEKSWLLGNSPTLGFLKFGTTGPLSGWYQSLAGNPIVDWLFMMGLLLVGLGLLTGIMMRLACSGGVALMLMIYFAAMPPKHNPVIDEHIIYIVVLVGIGLVLPNQWTIKHWWRNRKSSQEVIDLKQ